MNHEEIVGQLKQHAESLREKLSGYEQTKEELRRCERALAVFDGGRPEKEGWGRVTNATLVMIQASNGVDARSIAQRLDARPATVLTALARLKARGLVVKKGSLYFPAPGEIHAEEHRSVPGAVIAAEEIIQALHAGGGEVTFDALAKRFANKLGLPRSTTVTRLRSHLYVLRKEGRVEIERSTDGGILVGLAKPKVHPSA